MMARSMVRRCPWCGGRGAFFTGWFTKQPHCRSCGLRWRRGDVGFELGAAAIAAMNTLGPLLVALGVTLTIMWPNTPVAPLLAAFSSVGAAVADPDLPVVVHDVAGHRSDMA